MTKNNSYVHYIVQNKKNILKNFWWYLVKCMRYREILCYPPISKLVFKKGNWFSFTGFPNSSTISCLSSVQSHRSMIWI